MTADPTLEHERGTQPTRVAAAELLGDEFCRRQSMLWGPIYT